jgi:hypothetical protein
LADDNPAERVLGSAEDNLTPVRGAVAAELRDRLAKVVVKSSE